MPATKNLHTTYFTVDISLIGGQNQQDIEHFFFITSRHIAP
jgi:hypothetical protein